MSNVKTSSKEGLHLHVELSTCIILYDPILKPKVRLGLFLQKE